MIVRQSCLESNDLAIRYCLPISLKRLSSTRIQEGLSSWLLNKAA